LRIHSAARGLHRVGAIDKATLREFDESCLAVPPEISAADIKWVEGIGLTGPETVPGPVHPQLSSHGKQQDGSARLPSPRMAAAISP
jgi:hypothetical protein